MQEVTGSTPVGSTLATHERFWYYSLMTFSRNLPVPVAFTVYRQDDPNGNASLQISLGNSYAVLPEADAQALADYINEKFPRETSS